MKKCERAFQFSLAHLFSTLRLWFSGTGNGSTNHMHCTSSHVLKLSQWLRLELVRDKYTHKQGRDRAAIHHSVGCEFMQQTVKAPRQHKLYTH